MAKIKLNCKYILETMDSYDYYYRSMITDQRDGDTEGAKYDIDCLNTKQAALYGASAITGISQKSFWNLRRVIRTFIDKNVDPDWYLQWGRDELIKLGIIDPEKILMTLQRNYQEPEPDWDDEIDDNDFDFSHNDEGYDDAKWDAYWSSRGVKTIDF